MKILKNDADLYLPVKTQCCYCNKYILIESKDDFHYNCNGFPMFKCPSCDNDVEIEEIPPIEITKDNILFPENFFRFKNAKKLSDEDINKNIKKLLTQMEEDDSTSFNYILSGDTAIFVFRDDFDINIFICKDYYETNINM